MKQKKKFIGVIITGEPVTVQNARKAGIVLPPVPVTEQPKKKPDGK
jgi:hypothetical protein